MSDEKLLAIAAGDDRGLDSPVAGHFGRCPAYVMVPVSLRRVGPARVIPNPFFNNHQPGAIPGFLHQQGADVILAGGMGGRAVELFQRFGIEVATGASGTVRQVLNQYLDGQLRGIVPCSHDHPESCGGHHDDAKGEQHV